MFLDVNHWFCFCQVDVLLFFACCCPLATLASMVSVVPHVENAPESCELTQRNGDGLDREADRSSWKDLGSSPRRGAPREWRRSGRRGSCRQSTTRLRGSLESLEWVWKDNEIHLPCPSPVWPLGVPGRKRSFG